MKRAIYIGAFTALGALVAFLIHAWVEIWYIGRLLADFPKYSLGFSWTQWVLIHNVGSAALTVTFAGLGFWQGKFWWPRLYGKRSPDAFSNF